MGEARLEPPARSLKHGAASLGGVCGPQTRKSQAFTGVVFQEDYCMSGSISLRWGREVDSRVTMDPDTWFKEGQLALLVPSRTIPRHPT